MGAAGEPETDAKAKSFERALLVKLLHDRHHDQDCERTADAILRRGFRLVRVRGLRAAALNGTDR